ASGNIAGDGSLVLKLYYTRNSYEVSYAYTGTVPAGASALPATASYKYGADVTVAPPAAAPGYTFNGWLEDGKVTASFKMPAGPVQLTGSFTANTDTRYTVEHWTEDLDGEGYTLRETEANLTGVTDTTATAETKSYEGFRFDEDNENNVLTGVITGDGKLVLKVYYARNSYEVSYDYGAAPTGASQLPGTVSYKYGAEVRVADKATAPGYTFDGWKKDNAEVTSFTMPAGAVQLTGRFTANTDTGYKVEHYQQNLAGDAFVLFETEEQNATTDTRVSATPKDYTGFTYDGTVDGTVTEGNVAGDGSLVLKLYYTRDSYKVTYQYTGKVPTGASELPAETTEKYGAAVTVAADATAPGYTFSGWSREDGFTMPAENVTITGSFTANGETPYKVEHYQQNLEDDGYTLAETENLTGETDTTATANPKTYTGFAFDGTAEGTVASGNIAGDGSLVLKLYYT
ncbi:MAG: InlB B-repeat-containing protein, partial [Ruthenibacterium lactatiformans]